jgi:hypothetical protein
VVKSLGVLGYNAHDGLIKDNYGSVILFKNKDDAVQSGALMVVRVVKAKMPRKKKTKEKE